MTAVTTKMPFLNLKLQDVVNLEANNVMKGEPLMRDMKTSRADYKEMLIMKTERQIKNDPNWYGMVKKQAEEKGISLEENLRNHATYMVNTQISKGEIQLPDE